MQIQLTTTGARSGRKRTVTLYAWPDGDGLVIVGSKGGSARHPSWVHNLRSHPRATVARGTATTEMSAREVTEDPERERLWNLVVEAFPLYAEYQRTTDRLIPLFLLQDADAAA